MTVKMGKSTPDLCVLRPRPQSTSVSDLPLNSHTVLQGARVRYYSPLFQVMKPKLTVVSSKHQRWSGLALPRPKSSGFLLEQPDLSRDLVLPRPEQLASWPPVPSATSRSPSPFPTPYSPLRAGPCEPLKMYKALPPVSAVESKGARGVVCQEPCV